MHVFEATRAAAERAVIAQRRRRGLLGLELCCAASVARNAKGELIEFVAADRALLARFVADFESYLHSHGDDHAELTVRLYEKGGSGARDPRTGAVIARYRDVLAGRLDALFEAYRHRTATSAAEPVS
jgi:hypothetical protein